MTRTLDDPTYIYPESYQATALAAFDRAHWLHRCTYEIMLEATHGAPDNLTQEQLNQRTALLTIAQKILASARDREMDLACAHWQRFRKMTE